MSSPPPLPLHKKLMFTGLIAVVLLLLAEGGLALAPRLFLARHAPPPPPMLALAGSVGTVVAVGDSVTAGVGAPAGQAWPDHLSLSLARDHVPLVRAVSPGAGLDFAGGAPLSLVEALPPASAPVVLVMLGHNDVLRWAPGARQGFERLRREARTGSVGGEAARWQGPRVVRALRWLWLAARRAPPAVEVPADLVPRMVAAWRPLQASAQARGGTLLLLTYLVPPPPPPGLDPELAAVITASGAAQAAVNAAIREAGGDLDAEILDLAQQVPVGAVWSLEVFVDHIHLSAETGARVAAAVYRALSGSGAGGDQGGGEERL